MLNRNMSSEQCYTSMCNLVSKYSCGKSLCKKLALMVSVTWHVTRISEVGEDLYFGHLFLSLCSYVCKYVRVMRISPPLVDNVPFPDMYLHLTLFGKQCEIFKKYLNIMNSYGFNKSRTSLK